MDESDVIPAARTRVAERLADVQHAAVGLEDHPEVAAAVSVMQNTLARLADALAAAGRAEKIEP